MSGRFEVESVTARGVRSTVEGKVVEIGWEVPEPLPRWRPPMWR